MPPANQFTTVQPVQLINAPIPPQILTVHAVELTRQTLFDPHLIPEPH